MWMAMPSVGLPFQPFGLAARPMSSPSLSSPGISGGIGGPSTASQTLPAASPLTSPMYGYGGSGTLQPGFPGPSLAAVYPLPPAPTAALFGSEPLTAASLLTAVAMHRGQPQGPANDQEIEEFIYDALELLPGTSEVEIRSESGRVTLTGTVQHKRLKRDVGEVAWAIPSAQDVQNNVSITSRRRTRTPGREGETAAATASPRKQG
jgi:BON domain